MLKLWSLRKEIKGNMEIKENLKKYWFVCVIALVSIVFVGVYAIQSYKNKPYEVKSLTHDGKQVVAKIGDSDYIYYDDLYDNLYETYGLSTSFRSFYRDVIRNAVKTDDDMSNYAANYVAYVQSYGYNDSYDAQLKQAGYKGIDELGTYVIDMLKQEEITGNYLLAHYDEIVAPFASSNNVRKVSHILVKVADVTEVENEDGTKTYVANPTEEETAKIDAVVAALNSGTSFEEVAKQYSEDGSASIGGLLGIVGEYNKSQYVEPFSTTSVELPVGEVSEVITTTYGYHILKADPIEKEELCKDTSFIAELTNTDSTPILKAVMEQADLLGYEIVSEDLKNEINNTLNGVTEAN